MKGTWGSETENKGWQGLNNAAINTFNSNVINSLVREMFQNSIDARDKNIASDGQPIKIKLRRFSITKKDFPSFQVYRNILDLIAHSGPNEKHKNFFENAFSDLDNNSKINIFAFEDYNTTGLSGDDNDPESSFSSCVLSEGTSVDKDDTAGGSYGIGKNAIFGFSKIRTVFYSSLSTEGEYIFQGVAKLASFYDSDGEQHGYRVYYGEGNNQNSMRNVNELPDKCKEFFKREEPGLSQFAVCPILRQGWVDEFVRAILRNYWLLIEKNELQVEIFSDKNQVCRLSSDNLEKLLLKYFNPDEYTSEDIEPDGNPYDYYLAYKNAPPVVGEIKNLGAVKFHCLELEHQNTNQVAYLRNDMTTYTDSVWGFGSIGYCGVFYCTELKGNAVLRMMEPPTHDSFDEARLDERSKDLTVKDGENIKKAIKSFIREPLNEILDKHKEPAEDIPWLDNLLESVLGEQDSGIGKRTGKSTKNETTQKIGDNLDVNLNFKSKSSNIYVNNIEGQFEETGGGKYKGTGRSGNGGNGGADDSSGGGPDSDKETNKSSITSRIYLTDSQLILSDKEYKKYKVILSADDNLKTDLVIAQQGDSGQVADFILGQVKDSEGHDYNFRPKKNSDGEIVSYLIESVKIPVNLALLVNEPYKSSFKIVKG